MVVVIQPGHLSVVTIFQLWPHQSQVNGLSQLQELQLESITIALKVMLLRHFSASSAWSIVIYSFVMWLLRPIWRLTSSVILFMENPLILQRLWLRQTNSLGIRFLMTMWRMKMRRSQISYNSCLTTSSWLQVVVMWCTVYSVLTIWLWKPWPEPLWALGLGFNRLPA